MRPTLGREIPTSILAQQRFEAPISGLKRGLSGGWYCMQDRQKDARLLLLDDALQIQKAFPLGESEVRNVAAEAQGRSFAASTIDRLLILDADGQVQHTLGHPQWPHYAGGDVIFDQSGRLWGVLAGEAIGETDRLCLIDPQTGQILAETFVQSNGGVFGLTLTPDQRGVAIDISCGQDGLYLYLAEEHEGQLQIRQVTQDSRGFGQFSPDDRRFITLAHENEDLAVHDFPSLKVIQTQTSASWNGAADLDDPDEYELDAFGYRGFFLNDEYILASTLYGRLLCFRTADLSLVGTVWPEGYELKAYFGGKRISSAEAEEHDMDELEFDTDLGELEPAGLGQFLMVQDKRWAQLVKVVLE